MDSVLIEKLLKSQTRAKKQIEITVVGVSMNPTLFERDIIVVLPQDKYELGDILVFNYKNGELLVHRLLDVKEHKYFCKGDNSFRLEDIDKEQIVGKVIAVKRNNEIMILKQRDNRLIILSKLVSRAFHKCRYDIEKTKQTKIYQLYEKTILRKGENIMIYKKNESMDYIQTDETALAVFDPETGDTHFFDETGIDILNILSEPCDLDMLLSKLCELYNATEEDIKSDVKEFLNVTVEKKVVEFL